MGPFDFGMGPDSYKFIRALYGLLLSSVLGVLVTWFTKPRPEVELKGFVAGTQKDATRQFKGSEPNHRPGGKVRLRVRLDPSLSGTDTVGLSRSALGKMTGESGDLLYASHIHWWYGGLRSVHVKADPRATSTQNNLLLISPENATTAHFVERQEVIVEKIM